MRSTTDDCFYCGKNRGNWTQPCEKNDGGHWTAAERIGALEDERDELRGQLCHAQPLLLAGADALAILELEHHQGRRAAKKARKNRRRWPDALCLETEAAKISDTIAVVYGDPSLATGRTFDRLEGRA